MLKIILIVLSVIAWIILLSVTAKKPVDPTIDLKEELEFVDLSNEEIQDCITKYKNTYSYKCYELQKAYYELGQAIINTFKKGE